MTDLFDLKSYQYDLPKELIAQYPLTDRSASKLMVVDRHTGQIDHKQFSNILDYLQDGEVLVLNKTKVIPARLFGKKDQKDIEILLLHSENDIEWSCLVRSSVKIKIGDIITISDDFKAELIEWKADGVRLVKFHFFESMAISDLIDKHGNMPLPPYITRKAETQDKDTYQTIYAKDKGSVAAPTAGLHFTPEIFEKLKEKGVLLAEVLLHVGLGTFRPVYEKDIRNHNIHSEYCSISEENANIINTAKMQGKRVIAVGTTSTRTLESFAKNKRVESGNKWTNLFIYPGKDFQIIDAQITNFHTPESSLLMLVSAFAGYDVIRRAYDAAIAEKYRFFSYGDAMYIH